MRYQREWRGRKNARIERLPHPLHLCSGSTGVPQWRQGGFWATIPFIVPIVPSLWRRSAIMSVT